MPGERSGSGPEVTGWGLPAVGHLDELWPPSGCGEGQGMGLQAPSRSRWGIAPTLQALPQAWAPAMASACPSWACPKQTELPRPQGEAWGLGVPHRARRPRLWILAPALPLKGCGPAARSPLLLGLGLPAPRPHGLLGDYSQSDTLSPCVTLDPTHQPLLANRPPDDHPICPKGSKGGPHCVLSLCPQRVALRRT